MEFKSFDSTDDMVEWMMQQRAQVQARTLAPEQEQIKYGDYALRFLDGLVLFVYVEPPVGEHPIVLTEMGRKDTDENMLMCKVFSSLVSGGEYGWLHRSVLWPLTEKTFKEAERMGWNLRLMNDRDRLEVEQAYQEMRLVVKP